MNKEVMPWETVIVTESGPNDSAAVAHAHQAGVHAILREDAALSGDKDAARTQDALLLIHERFAEMYKPVGLENPKPATRRTMQTAKR